MSSSRYSLLKELLIALSVSCLALLLLPGLIYLVGSRLFGPYGGGWLQLYRNTMVNLAAFMPSAWLLVLAPGLCCLALRAIQYFAADDQPDAPADQDSMPRRREPTIS